MRNLIGISIFGLLGFVPALAEEGPVPLPAEAFAKVPVLSSPSLSADGTVLAAIVAAPGTNNEDTALATWDLTNPNAGPVITPSGDRMKFVATDALKQGNVLVIGRQEWTGRLGGCGEGRVTGATKTFALKSYLTDSKQKEFEEAFSSKRRPVGVSKELQECFEIAGSAGLVSTLPLDPENVIINQVDINTLRGDYYKYNLKSGKTELMFRETGSQGVAFINPRDGEVLVRSEIEPIGGDYEIRLLFKEADGSFDEHEKLTYKASTRHDVSISGLDEATGNFYVSTDLFSDKSKIFFYDPRAREFSQEPVLAHPDYSTNGVILGTRPSNYNKLLGFSYSGPAGNDTFWIDPEAKSLVDGLKQAFPETGAGLLDYTDNYETVLFQTSSGAHPPAYYLFDKATSKVRPLGNSRPWIDPDNLRKPEWVSYEARDGLAIPSVLTLPKGFEKGKDEPIAAIVLPHGGPWSRDGTGWDGSGWPQFLASRNIAVLQPNYRGSTGLGRELWLAGDAEWGQKMQDDKDDGAAWLVEQGIADPDKIAIFGYSYGGFAAMAAAVRPDSPFQCAIAGAGVSNLTRLGNNWSDNKLQRVIQGVTVTGMDPDKNTDKASIPIMMYHGDRDVRVPLFHAVDFHAKMKNAGTSELHVIKDMPHSLPWYPEHHRETLGLIEDYLQNRCGPGGLFN
jgi:pimeloyl-ACP methyl ester carboxylesterase